MANISRHALELPAACSILVKLSEMWNTPADLGGLLRGLLDHVKVFLSDDGTAHAEPKLIAAWSGKHE